MVPSAATMTVSQATLVAVRRETNSWTYPMMMAAYLFALAYAASFITYRLALMGGGG